MNIRCKKTGKRLLWKGGKMFEEKTGKLVEFFQGEWKPVLDIRRTGWYRFHEHYNRGGYCDDPARGY